MALESQLPGSALLESLNVTGNVERYLSFIRTCRSRAKKKTNVEEPSVNAVSGTRFLK